ncbi:type IV pilus twitching motility protein PilT [Nitratifractor sp.]
MKELDDYLKLMSEEEGSDLHLRANTPIFVRKHGKLVKLDLPPLTETQYLAIIDSLLSKEQKERLHREKTVTLSYQAANQARYRIHLFFEMQGVSIVIRLIPEKIPRFDTLHLPKSVEDFIHLESGLVIIAGPTNSGKSTTMASLIDAINRKQSRHIITIESPIEFVHKNINSLISQREIGIHTLSYERAIKAAMSEDADIITIGRLQHSAAIQSAIKAANADHLVFATMDANDIQEVLHQITSSNNENFDQHSLNKTLASTLKGIVVQHLIESVDGSRVPAVELLKNTPHIHDLIMKEKFEEIPAALEAGYQTYQTQTFYQSIRDLYRLEYISEETATRHLKDSKYGLLLQGIRHLSHNIEFGEAFL